MFHPRQSVAKKIYLIAGEASGDARGAEVMRALRQRDPSLEFFGAGGREMQALAGGDFLDWADEAVVGLWDVLRKYGYFKAQLDRMLAEIVRLAPAAVIFVDYPGFNLRLAKQVKARAPAVRTIHYISPQVWAWHRRRISQMAKFLDLMLCIFPFEQPLYEASGLHTVFVGHPLLDSLEARRIDGARDPDLVGLFPGSREKEVRRIFPVLLEAAEQIHRERPATRFEVAAASHQLAGIMIGLLHHTGRDESFCKVHERSSHELMQRAAAGMVCSGTATLEAAFFGLPMCIIYKVAWLTWVVGKRLVRVPYLGMPNVLAGREIAREFLQGAATGEAIGGEILRLLRDPGVMRALERDLAEVIRGLGERGAARRAAEAIGDLLALPS